MTMYTVTLPSGKKITDPDLDKLQADIEASDEYSDDVMLSIRQLNGKRVVKLEPSDFRTIFRRILLNKQFQIAGLEEPRLHKIKNVYVVEDTARKRSWWAKIIGKRYTKAIPWYHYFTWSKEQETIWKEYCIEMYKKHKKTGTMHGDPDVWFSWLNLSYGLRVVPSK